MVEKIKDSDNLLALVIRNSENFKKTEFFTAPDSPLQLGALKYEKGDVVKPHVHKAEDININRKQEVLYVKKGSAEVSFFGTSGGKVNSSIIREGDIVMFVDGGHGIEIKEDSEIIEIKQGPYKGRENDKRILGENR